MKKMKKRIFGLLMASLMICLPAMQALAQTYDVNVMAQPTILFPGDVLTGIAAPVMLDGIPADLGGVPEAPAAWTNADENKVYSAGLAEDGTGMVVLALAGYELDVTGGTSEAGDETTGPIGGHYVMTPEEEAALDPAAPKTDRAYYPAYTVVKLKAEEPKEGMMFDKWTVEPTLSGAIVTVEDETNRETTVTMPEEKVKITANYREAAPHALSVAYGIAIAENEDGTGTYTAGTPITVTADDCSSNGYAFNGWTVVSQNVELADIGSPTTSFVMPEGDVQLAATYVDAEGNPVADPTQPPQTEAQTDAPVEPEYSEGTGEPTDPTYSEGTGEPTDPTYSEGTGEPIDPTYSEGTGEPTDPTYSEGAGEPTDPAYSEDTGEPTDMTYPEGSGDPVAPAPEIDMGTAPEITIDPNMGAGDSILSGVDEEEINITINDSYDSNDPIMSVPAESNGDETDPPAADNAIRYMLNVDYGTVTAENSEGVNASQGFTAGTVLTVTANDYSANGYTFSGWAAGPQNAELILTDSSSATTSFAMPAGDVLLTAQYIDGNGIPVNDPTQPQAEAETQPETQPETQTDTTQTEAPVETETEPVQPETSAETEPTPTEISQSGEQTVDVSLYGDGTESAADVTVTVVGGTTTGTNENPSTAAASGTYPLGGTINITTSVPAGQQFTGWTATGTKTDGANEVITTFGDPKAQTTTFILPEAAAGVNAITLTANFTPQCTVTVTNGLTNNGTNTMAVDSGTQVTLTANAAPAGQVFSNWTVAEGLDLGANAVNPTITVTVNQNLNFTANYKPIEYQIRVNSGSANYEKAAGGTVVTLTAGEAPKGMEFDYWKVDTGNVSLQNAYGATTTFAMPTAEVTVSANYKMKEYHVTVQNGYSDEEVYYMGDEVTVYSNYPSSGREFDQWEKVEGKVSFADASRWKTTFTMPARDVTVSATYKDGPSPESNQIQELAEGGEYITDSTIRFTAAGAGMDNSNPNPGDYRYRPSGYQIGNVTGSWQESPYTTSMSIKARGDYTLKVTYNKEVFDGNTWAADGTSDTRSVSFRVLTPAEAVKTGDETPIAMMVTLAGASCLMFLLLLSVFLRRRKNF